MKSQQTGFTLVELIVVIVILGILAATALPRFINVTTDAQHASVRGFAGGVTSAVGMVQAAYFASGNMTATTAVMADTTSITVTAGTGIPTGASGGIGSAIRCNATDCNGFTAVFASPTSTFTPTFTGGANCPVSYNASSGAVTIENPLDCGA